MLKCLGHEVGRNGVILHDLNALISRSFPKCSIFTAFFESGHADAIGAPGTLSAGRCRSTARSTMVTSGEKQL